jgi:glycosyltransferase involved in cell wall biosynthesis
MSPPPGQRSACGLTRSSCSFLGRKTTYKGLAQCVATQQALWSAGHPVWLLAVGPETDFSRDLWAHQRAANAMAGIIVRDTVSDTERLQALAACNVVTLPSIGEAFGIIYLEGWTYRKPVIGMAIDSVASVVTHGSDGFLVDPADPGQMTGYVRRLLAEPDSGAPHGRRRA